MPAVHVRSQVNSSGVVRVISAPRKRRGDDPHDSGRIHLTPTAILPTSIVSLAWSSSSPLQGESRFLPGRFVVRSFLDAFHHGLLLLFLARARRAQMRQRRARREPAQPRTAVARRLERDLALEDAQEDLLRDVEGVGVVRDDPPCRAVDLGVVRVHQGFEVGGGKAGGHGGGRGGFRRSDARRSAILGRNRDFPAHQTARGG